MGRVKAKEGQYVMTQANLQKASANRKPKGVSDVRWRIELRRRANPERYALAPDANTVARMAELWG